MNVILPQLQGVVLVYLLTFSRAGAMIMLLPVIGDAGVPARVRLAFALAVSAALVSVTARYYPTNTPPPLELAALIAREATAGVLVGTMARLIMSTLETAGTLIAVQTGLAFATTLDPGQGTQSAIVSTFLSLVGSLLVFETGLHHLAIGAISGSYTLLPPNQAFPAGDMAEMTLNLVSGSFALGLQLASPFIVFGLLIYATLGVLSRLMPQLQIFFLAMPVSILTGFVLLMLFLGVMMTAFLDFFAGQMRLFGG
ncbi:MAG TPA: flagellar biosynthetic protein FliR [Micropepsaceae bacterium]